MEMVGMRFRLKNALIHAFLSGGLACLLAAVVFYVWYPQDYRQLSGGAGLFVIVMAVDVLVGPFLTLVVSDARKKRVELWRDWACIGLVQLAALLYGVHAVYLARPVALVYELDRFRVIAAVDVEGVNALGSHADDVALSNRGPVLLGTRALRSDEEKMSALDMALQGVDIGQRPAFWCAYEQVRSSVRARARELAELRVKSSTGAALVQARLSHLGLSESNVRWVALQGKQRNGVVLLNQSGDVLDVLAMPGDLF
jgi:hypothetical protein